MIETLPNRKTIRLAVGLAACILATAAGADDAVERGGALVETTCRFCHPRPSDPPDPVMTETFETIVARPGRDEAYLTQFLHEEHFPMTSAWLDAREKADVVAWLLALQETPPPDG